MSRRSEHTTKVFVGSLPPDVTTDDLRRLFSPYGSIAECDIANRCGFLHLEDKDLANKAIDELNNSTFMGGRISVEKGRVKPKGGDRRMRTTRGGGGGGGGGGGIGGRKREMGPYSREGSGYGGRGMQRNGGGNYGRGDYSNYGDYRSSEYGRGGYDDGYDRRPSYEDRRGGGGGGGAGGGSYMNDRRSYNNGYDRRSYSDDRTPYSDNRGGYDDRRMPPSGQSSYEERRGSMTERRPLLDDGMTQRAQMNTYDRSSNDMFSRRDSAPKPLSASYDRSSQSGYNTTNYSNPVQATNNYNTTAPMSGYTSTGSGGGGSGSGYNQAPIANYDTRAQSSSFIDNRQQSTSVSSGYTTQGYSTQPPSGSYGDNYGARAPQTNTYDSSYPPLPQQRSFAGGNPPGPHRDMPPARRYN